MNTIETKNLLEIQRQDINRKVIRSFIKLRMSGNINLNSTLIIVEDESIIMWNITQENPLTCILFETFLTKARWTNNDIANKNTDNFKIIILDGSQI